MSSTATVRPAAANRPAAARRRATPPPSNAIGRGNLYLAPRVRHAARIEAVIANPSHSLQVTGSPYGEYLTVFAPTTDIRDAVHARVAADPAVMAVAGLERCEPTVSEARELYHLDAHVQPSNIITSNARVRACTTVAEAHEVADEIIRELRPLAAPADGLVKFRVHYACDADGAPCPLIGDPLVYYVPRGALSGMLVMMANAARLVDEHNTLAQLLHLLHRLGVAMALVPAADEAGVLLTASSEDPDGEFYLVDDILERLQGLSDALENGATFAQPAHVGPAPLAPATVNAWLGQEFFIPIVTAEQSDADLLAALAHVRAASDENSSDGDPSVSTLAANRAPGIDYGGTFEMLFPSEIDRDLAFEALLIRDAQTQTANACGLSPGYINAAPGAPYRSGPHRVWCPTIEDAYAAFARLQRAYAQPLSQPLCAISYPLPLRRGRTQEDDYVVGDDVWRYVLMSAAAEVVGRGVPLNSALAGLAADDPVAAALAALAKAGVHARRVGALPAREEDEEPCYLGTACDAHISVNEFVGAAFRTALAARPTARPASAAAAARARSPQ